MWHSFPAKISKLSFFHLLFLPRAVQRSHRPMIHPKEVERLVVDEEYLRDISALERRRDAYRSTSDKARVNKEIISLQTKAVLAFLDTHGKGGEAFSKLRSLCAALLSTLPLRGPKIEEQSVLWESDNSTTDK